MTRAVTSHEFGYALSDARFDWLVGNMIVYEENIVSFIELFLRNTITKHDHEKVPPVKG